MFYEVLWNIYTDIYLIHIYETMIEYGGPIHIIKLGKSHL